MSLMESKKNRRRQERTRQSTEYEEAGIDPFSRPPPGYGLTQSPNKWPWERPPTHTTVEEAFEDLKKRMLEPAERFDLVRLMDAGVPIETLVRTITFGAFTEGLMSPDVAEMVNIPLGAHLIVEARRAGITPKVDNNIKVEVTSDKDITNLMKSLNPEKYLAMVNGDASQEAPPESAPPENSKSKMEGFMASVEKEAKQQENADG